MSNTSKIIMWVIAAAVVIGAVWYFTRASKPVSSTGITAVSQTSQSRTTSSSVRTVAAVTATSPTSATDTSDAAINQDAANIDGQMNALNADNLTADAAMNNPSQ